MGMIINPYAFAVAATDPDFASVVALLHFDGTNGSTTFTDEIGNFWVVGLSSPDLDTSNKAFGSASFKVDYVNSSSSDAIRTASSASLRLGTSDFTMEGFFDPDVPVGSIGIWYNLGENTSDGLAFGVTPTTVWWRNTGGDLSATVTVNAWDHVAWVREGTARRIYVNGVLAASDAGGSFNNSSAADVFIGNVSSNHDFGFLGHIDEVRITKGVARYSGSSFTPPSSAFPNS
jgi:hypothetical protein